MNARRPTPRRRPATVGDLMALDPIVDPDDASLTERRRPDGLHDISGLPVVDADGEVVGVISQTDLVRARATEYLWANWTGLAVRHLMTSPPLTVRRSTSLDDAAGSDGAQPRPPPRGRRGR